MAWSAKKRFGSLIQLCGLQGVTQFHLGVAYSFNIQCRPTEGDRLPPYPSHEKRKITNVLLLLLLVVVLLLLLLLILFLLFSSFS